MKSLLGIVRRPDVIFRANGRFDLTSRVVKTLGISAGDVVDILIDGKEYYLYVVPRTRHNSLASFETQVYPSNKKGHHFRGSSVRLCRSILQICGAKKHAALSCGEPFTNSLGCVMLPIIIQLNLSQND